MCLISAADLPQVSTKAMREALVERVREQLKIIHSSQAYGKHIIARVEKLLKTALVYVEEVMPVLNPSLVKQVGFMDCIQKYWGRTLTSKNCCKVVWCVGLACQGKAQHEW